MGIVWSWVGPFLGECQTGEIDRALVGPLFQAGLGAIFGLTLDQWLAVLKK